MSEETEVENERIDVADGNVTVPGVYEGPVTCHIESEFYCSDIYVEFDPDLVLPKVEKQYGGLYDCPPFCKAVAALIAKQNDLGEGEFDLDRAELGMQGNTYCAFEGFSKDKKDIGREFFLSKGAKDLSAVEEKKEEDHRQKMEKKMTPVLNNLLDDRQKLFLEYIENLRASLTGTYKHFKNKVTVYLHQVLGEEWQKIKDDDVKRYIKNEFFLRTRDHVDFSAFGGDTYTIRLESNEEDDEEGFFMN